MLRFIIMFNDIKYFSYRQNLELTARVLVLSKIVIGCNRVSISFDVWKNI